MNTVVIMAGGFGLRLHPLTEHTPKPMLKVGQKPMLEHLINRFIDQGFKNFVFMVHYKSKIIVEYFGTGKEFGCNIQYVEEQKPQGTAGGIRLIKPHQAALDRSLIVCNADIVCDVDYTDLINFHYDKKAAITAVSTEILEQIHFGVLNIQNDVLLNIEEKPIYPYQILAGLYVLSPEVINLLPRAGAYSMPDLILKTLNEKQNVKIYPLDGNWQDLGTFEAYGEEN